ncbi:hypothetical protein LshimejAT787_0505680 [Lyophyllum shimeji]|uniref:Uncharacterized protein n=1 Tax=Lyophyllum shimeji TaxID=47721 RepID=A0A9P3PNJ1_LYOSH|nr:hypothetical protein LshimejAT787_0505680 [Lyophyllum shimeji]
MKYPTFTKRATRSGATYSPFLLVPIENPDFDLANAVKFAHEEGAEDDDPILAFPAPDPCATEFWRCEEAAATFAEPLTAPPSIFSTECLHAIGHQPGISTAADRGSLALCASSPGLDLSSAAGNPAAASPPCLAASDRPTSSDRDVPTIHSDPNKRSRPEGVNPQLEVKRRKRNDRVHGKRRKRLDAEASLHGHHAPRPKVIAAHVTSATAFQTDLDRQKLPATSCGYAAPSKLPGEGVYFTSLEEVLAQGYRLIPWDGRAAMPLLCSEGRIFAVLAGQAADDATYAESCWQAYEAITAEGRDATFSYAETHHRRGDFPAVNVGTTMGLGATYPTNRNNNAHGDMVSHLLQNQHIIRLANFADSAFNLWAPNVHKHYRERLNALFSRLTYLKRIFPRCIFPAAAFNFGGHVCTKSHRDCMNSAIGWCGIFGLGPYDPKKGGHLVLPDLKLVVEFPPALSS